MKDNGRLTFKQQLRLTAFAVGLSSIIFLIVGVGNIVRQQAAERGAARVATRSAGEVVRVEETAVSATATQIVTPFLTSTSTRTGSTVPTQIPAAQIDNNRPFGSADLSESLIPSPTPRPNYYEFSTPTSPPAQDINQLVDSLSLEQVQLNNGFQTSRVNGGWYGYRRLYYCDGPYRWLDDDHLILRPVIAYINYYENPTSGEITQPVILTLGEDAPWIMNTPPTVDCQTPIWSESRQQLIEASAGEVRLRDLSGEVVQTYPGDYPLHIAPSGQRILAGNNWIDLETGEINGLANQRVNYPNPAWSADERQFFDCCFSYGNVDSGEYWVQHTIPGMQIPGMGIDPGYTGRQSHWVGDDTAVMISSLFRGNGTQPVIPILDPATRAFEDAFTRLNLPEEINNCYPQIAPTGAYFWLNCNSDQEQYLYLVALPSWEVMAVPELAEFRSWSPNGRFLIYTRLDDSGGDSGTTWLMDVEDGMQLQVADFVATNVKWTADSQTAALYLQGEKTIQFISAGGDTQWATSVAQPIYNLLWQPNNVGILIITGNLELDWMPDVKANTRHSLTPNPISVDSVQWSPEGNKISFLIEQELFIIDLTQPVEPKTESSGSANSSVISQDGNIVAFISTGNLTGNAGGETLSVFVRDVAAGTTELVNITTEGVAGFDHVYNVAMSGNGRYIAYYSSDDNLKPADAYPCMERCGPGYEDLFIYDRETQLTNHIPLGRLGGLGADYTISLSVDGRFVAYSDRLQLYIYDQDNSTAISVLSTITDEPSIGGYTIAPNFAANGDLVFISTADDLVANDNNNVPDVFIRDQVTGNIERISVATDGTEGNHISGAVSFHEGVGNGLAISGNARFIAYTSLATNLTDDELLQCNDPYGGTRNCYNIFLYDRETGTTRLVSSIWGAGDGDSTQPSLSDDGRYLTFTSYASNLFLESYPSCGQFCGQIYLLDLQTGVLALVSQLPGDVPLSNGSGWMGQISGNGRYVTFVSIASNLIENDTNNSNDIFRYDIETKKLERISLNNVP